MSPRSFPVRFRWLLVLLLAATALGGCDLFREAGTREAVRALRLWIDQPAAEFKAEAGKLAIRERQTIEYLRAVREQGIALQLRVENINRPASGQRRVVVVVGDKARDGIEERARFIVYVQRNEKRQWNVTRLVRVDPL